MADDISMKEIILNTIGFFLTVGVFTYLLSKWTRIADIINSLGVIPGSYSFAISLICSTLSIILVTWLVHYICTKIFYKNLFDEKFE